MYQNPRRLRRPEERVGNVTNADLPPPSLATNDRSLLARIRAGDEAAYTQLARSLHPAMLRVAMSFVRSVEEAEEVIQDTWLAAISGIDRFEGRSSLKTWIFRILINRARSRAKREARLIPFSALSAEDDDTSALIGTPTLPRITSSVPSPEQEVLNDELRDFLERAVRSLPRPQRVVISLRDIEGWSADEVCNALKITPGHQRVLLHRARMKVREFLGPYL